jgi:ribosomal-protein-alanine N-acetyltransferase
VGDTTAPTTAQELATSTTLRPLRRSDAASLTRLWDRNNANLGTLLPGVGHEPPSETALRRHCENLELARAEDRRYAFGIWADSELLGTLSLSNVIRGPLLSATLGLWLDRQARGRGVGKRAICLACRTAFEELGLHRLEAGVQPTNLASLGALRANGFTDIGLAHNYLLIGGRWTDHLLLERIDGS